MSKQKVFRQWYYVYVVIGGKVTYIPIKVEEVQWDLVDLKAKYHDRSTVLLAHTITQDLPEIKNILTK